MFIKNSHFIEIFVSSIQQAAWDNTLPIAQQTKENNYPKEIRNLISEKKRKLSRKLHQTTAPMDKTSLNNVTHQLKREIEKI